MDLEQEIVSKGAGPDEQHKAPQRSSVVIRECKCDLRTRLVGDGCDVCNPEYAADHAAEEQK